MASSATRSSPRVEAPLERAAALLRQDLPPELRQLPPEVLAAHLAWVLAHDHGDVPSADERPAAPVLVLRRLIIDELRARLVALWCPGVDQVADVHGALQALEAARLACRPEREHAFVTELADLGGLNLVVEVAHDMRSPLTSILFLSEILHKGQSGPLNDVQKHQVGIIYSAALGLENIASDMIEAARSGQRQTPGSPVPFSVNDISNAILGLVRPMAEEKGLKVSAHPLRAALRLGHPIPLSRVLLNLCTNALKFTQQGSVELTARSLGSSRVEFAVRDTGPGISPDAAGTLFEPFRREPGRASGYVFSGTGLGLAICRRLVAAMGSELRFDTTPGVGTRFWFVLELPPADFL